MASDYVQLHEQVILSTSLLDSLQSFLSTFQRDLSAVSDQIANLQLQSRDIDTRLQSRKKIETSLDNLIGELCVPPSTAFVILDQPVDDSWFEATEQLEQCMLALQPRSKLRATKDLFALTEGLRIVVATKLRLFFLDSLAPIRSSMSTNLPVIQSNFLAKHAPLYAFLRHWATDVADEFQAAYIAAVRTYYETGFRRYIRNLTQIKGRHIVKATPITVSDKSEEELDLEQISHNASVSGTGVTLAFMADTKTFTESLPSLFRSALMVLLDNTSVEYTFLEKFFVSKQDGKVSEEHKTRYLTTAAAWMQIMEPSLQHCDKFINNFLDPPPPTINFLTMIKLIDAVLLETQVRQIPPLETFFQKIRLSMWPVFQKQMHIHYESLQKLMGGAVLKTVVKDSTLSNALKRYLALFISTVSLCSEEEGMVFSNLNRLREEVLRLIMYCANQVKFSAQRGEYLKTSFEVIVDGLVKHASLSTHQKVQAELSFWKHKETDLRAQQTNNPRKSVY